MNVVPFSEFFPYVHPLDADALALTSKWYHNIVNKEYTRVGRLAVLPGGCWHYRLCKRARVSVTQVFPNTKPKALASLVDSTCFRCGHRLLARVSTWGFMAHAPCVRDLLINTFYIPEKVGLGPQELADLPQETRQGFQVVYREQYDYQVVFRRPFHRIVPVEWTLKYAATVVHVKKVVAHRDQQRAVTEMLKEKAQRKRQQQLTMAQKRRDALATRRAKLEAHPCALRIEKVRWIVGPRLFGDYLDLRITCKTSLARIVARTQNVPWLLKVLPLCDIMDLDADPGVLVRVHVKRCLDDMLQNILIGTF